MCRLRRGPRRLSAARQLLSVIPLWRDVTVITFRLRSGTTVREGNLVRRLPRIAVAAVAATTVGGLALTGTASAAPARTALGGSVPPWAAGAALEGAAATGGTVGFRVYLGWRNSAQAEALASAVSTPGNAQYGKYLTPAQFRQQFAPSQADVTAVQQWLRDSGFTVDYTPGNNHYVAAEGTVAQADAAFGTTIGSYRYQGRTLRAPESTLSVPAGLPAIAGVVGLDDSAALVHTDSVVADAPPSEGFRNAGPTSAYFGQYRVATTPTPDGTKLPAKPNYSFAPTGYTPAQIRGAYGLDKVAQDGTGVTVAIVDAYASPTIVSDVNTYSARHGLPQLKANQFTQVVAPGTYRTPENPAQDPQGWYGEETLDVEAVHTTAPGANIVYVGSANNYSDLDAALNHVVDNKLATIVTNSYGFSGEALPYGNIKPMHDTLVQAAAEGIGIYFSSGDDADETGGVAGATATPDWPASDPFVTAVGGTSLAVGKTNNYVFEAGWETGRQALAGGKWAAPTFQYGSGGGTSRLFAQPAYQAGVVPGSIATANGSRSQAMRTVPDVAALGDPNTGMLVGQTQTFPDGVSYDEYRIGGTSLASPLFAGMMAVAQQKAGRVLGFANPALYRAAGSSAYHDVKAWAQTGDDSGVVRSDYVNGVDASGGYAYTVRRLGYDGVLTIHARTGYDDVTGVGSPTGAAFLGAVTAP
jgi:subtilase family serine protease